MAVLFSLLVSVVALVTVAVLVYVPAATDSDTCTTISSGVSEAPGTNGCVLAAVQVTTCPEGIGVPGDARPPRPV